MSVEEHLLAMDDVIEEVKEGRQKRKYAARNTVISSFHDARTMVDQVVHEVFSF